METVTLYGVEIFSAGTWNNDTYSDGDIAAMVAAFHELKDRLSPPLKLGHNDEQKILAKDGLPAAGWISNLFQRGGKLLADIAGVPRKVADLIKTGAFRKRSAEIWWDYTDPGTGLKFPRVLCGLALLGADLPAVTCLDDILALYGGAKTPNLKAYIGEFEIAEEPDGHPYAIGGSRNLPISPKERAWDGAAAAKRIFEWAGGDEFSATKARRGFVYYDADAPEKRGSYKMPFADVIDGKLMAVWNGCKAAMGAVHGSRGGVDMPDEEKRRAHSFLASYYKKFDMEPPEMKMEADLAARNYEQERFKLEKTNPAVTFAAGGGDSEAYCGGCRFYRGKYVMECALVEGDVRPGDTCNLYQAFEESGMPMINAASAGRTQEREEAEMPEEKKEQPKGAALDETKLREQIREEERAKLAKEGAEKEARLVKENEAMQTRIAVIEDDREREKAEQAVRDLSTEGNMRIIPALVPLATYLLHQSGKPQPKKYAAKEGEAPIEIKEAFARFLHGLPNLTDFGLFDEKTLAVNAGSGGKDEVWTYEREMKEPIAAVQRRVAAYRKEHAEASEVDAMDAISKGSGEGKALIDKYARM